MPSAVPLQLVAELAEELAPRVFGDGLVQSRFGCDARPWLFDRAGRGLHHIHNPQVLDADDRVVFADRVREFMQKIQPGGGYAGMQTLNARFGLLPVFAEPLVGELLNMA